METKKRIPSTSGYHKTLAAAMEHRKINALVIMPCYTWQLRQTDGTLQPRLVSGEFSFDCDAYGINEEASYMGEKISFEKMEAKRCIVLMNVTKFLKAD